MVVWLSILCQPQIDYLIPPSILMHILHLVLSLGLHGATSKWILLHLVSCHVVVGYVPSRSMLIALRNEHLIWPTRMDCTLPDNECICSSIYGGYWPPAIRVLTWR